MTVLLVVVIVAFVLVRWRLGHYKRRKEEAAALQLQHRPLSEFDARFPADRRISATGRSLGRRSKKGLRF